MNNELIHIYSEIKAEIRDRLAEFSQIRNSWKDKIIFKELCFCLLTPQSKARSAWKAIEILWNNDMLFMAESSEIAEILNIVRFKNNKAKYIVLLRDQFFNKKENRILKMLESDIPLPDKRKWLVKNIKGIGFKEASHFLRNIGFFEDIAILDRHILRNLVQLGIIDDIPKTITERMYLETEEKMRSFSNKINIPLEYLDFVFWHKENNEIFK